MQKINPNRLREARLVKGYNTQESLAERIGKTKSLISKWESGKLLPDTEALIQLGELFDVSVDWFYRHDVLESSVFQYRSNSQTTKNLRNIVGIRLKWLGDITHTLEEWIEFPSPNLPKAPSRLHALNLDDNEIEAYAQQLRKCWQLDDKPIRNLIGIAEANGIISTKEFINSNEMDGVSVWFGDKPFIWLAKDKNNYYRSRFDIAHELGHIVLHRYLSYSDYQERLKEIERQAHLFASHLLMPRKALLLNHRSITLDNLLILKKHWGVSVAALIMQYHNLRVIDNDYKLRLFKNYSYRKWRKSEPFDEQTTPEEPSILRKTLELLIEEGGFDKQDILDKLSYGGSHLEDLCSLPKGFFNAEPAVPTKLRIIK